MHWLSDYFIDIRRHELLKAGDRVGVAVSGGIDSVSLLRMLLELRSELGIVLSVVHFNHKLRATESDADEQFVAELARTHDLEFYCDSDDVAGHARDEGVSLEAAARELRYGFFHSLIIAKDSDPQGLKPDSLVTLNGTAEAVPLQEQSLAEAVPLQEQSLAESVPLQKVSPTEVAPLQESSLDEAVPLREVSFLRSASAGTALVAHLDKIVTGHTLDDQAETVLMRLIRGSGMRGLGAVHPRISVEDDDGDICGEIQRPLLATRRKELEAYLRDIGQSWRDDATNEDEKFTRNRIRKLVVPVLEKDFNPSVTESLAELAEIARGEEDYWENEVAGWMGTAIHWSHPDWVPKETEQSGLVQIVMTTGNPAGSSASDRDETSSLQARIEGASWLVMNAAVDRMWFLGEPLAVQRRAVKAIGEQAGIPLEFKHVEEVLSFAAEEGGKNKQLSLPLGWKVARNSDQLLFLTPDLRERAPDQDYEYDLSIPGRVVVREAGLTIEANRVLGDGGAGYNPDHLLDADSLPGLLRVRNWRAGDRFWPCHTKSPKKIKELLQELHLAQPQRKLWPVVSSGEEIVWVRGFPSATQFRAKPGGPAVQILEKSLADDVEK